MCYVCHKLLKLNMKLCISSLSIIYIYTLIINNTLYSIQWKFELKFFVLLEPENTECCIGLANEQFMA